MIGGILKIVLFTLMILQFVSCDTSTNPEPDPEDVYFPLKEGNWWSIKQENEFFEPLESFIDTCKLDTNFFIPGTVYNVGHWGCLTWDDGALYEVYNNNFRRMLIPKNKEFGTRFNESETEYWSVGEPYGDATTIEAGTFENCIVIYRMRIVEGNLYQERNDIYAKGVGRINTHIYNGWLPPPSGIHQELTSYYTGN